MQLLLLIEAILKFKVQMNDLLDCIPIIFGAYSKVDFPLHYTLKRLERTWKQKNHAIDKTIVPEG